jgi:hypothetical protein
VDALAVGVVLVVGVPAEAEGVVPVAQAARPSANAADAAAATTREKYRVMVP